MGFISAFEADGGSTVAQGRGVQYHASFDTTGWCDAVYTSSITNLVRKGDTTHFVPPNARHVLPFGHTSLLLVCACCVYLFTLFGHT